MELGKLLTVLTPFLDHTRVVMQMKRGELITLALTYMKNVQKEDIDAVNTAINEIYVEEENYEELKLSIEKYGNFDQIDLAQKIEDHELLEFRRIAAQIYKRKGRFEESVKLSKRDNMFKDAIDTVASSKNGALADELLRFFVDGGDSESFCAMLYTCYDLVSPDVAIELAWRHDLTDSAMPYVIQYVQELEKRLKDLEALKPKKKEGGDDFAEDPSAMGGGPMMLANTAFNPAAAMQQQMGGQMGGMQMGGQMQPGMGGMQQGMGGGMQMGGGGMGGGMQMGGGMGGGGMAPMGGGMGMPQMATGMDAFGAPGAMGGGF